MGTSAIESFLIWRFGIFMVFDYSHDTIPNRVEALGAFFQLDQVLVKLLLELSKTDIPWIVLIILFFL